MAEFFVYLLLGHLLGDYVFQTNWMAMNKSASTWKCLVHCWVYTAWVFVFTIPFISGGWLMGVLWFLFIFASHFPIDRWSLADKWMKFIDGRSLSEFMEKGYKNIPFEDYDDRFGHYYALRAGFTALCYAVVDNTFHLLIIFFGYKLLFA
jgi:hypothetical protein